MKSPSAVILAMFAISIACYAQNSASLDLAQQRDGFDVSAKLAPSHSWDGDKGNAKLTIITGTNAVVTIDAAYKVENSTFHAHIPAGVIPEKGRNFAGILTYPVKGKRQGGTGVYLIKIEPKNAQSPAGSGGSGTVTPGTTAPVGIPPPPQPNSQADQGVSQTGSEATGQLALGEPKHDEPQSSWLEEFSHGQSPAWLSQILLLLVLVLALVLVLWIMISSARIRRELKELDFALQERQGQDRLERQNSSAMAPAISRTDPQAASAFEEAHQAMRSVERLDAELKQLRHTAEGLSGSVDSLRLLGDDFRATQSSLRQWKQREKQPASPVLKLAIPLEAAALVAVVNRWLAQGSGDRSQLPELAQETRINAKLVAHKDLNRVFQDLTTFEYPFEFSPEGGWLWAAIPGGGEFWAVPTDAAFFSMGSAPLLLDRLFDGFRGAKTGFQFAKMYRPCRLRAVSGASGKYALVERGLLQLQGALAPAEPDPAAFESFLPQSSPSAGSSGSAGLGQLLAEWIRQAGRQLEDHAEELGSIRESVRSADRVRREVPEEKLQQLRFDLNERLERCSARIEAIERLVRQPSSEPAAPRQVLDRSAGGVSAGEKADSPRTGSLSNVATASNPELGECAPAGLTEVPTDSVDAAEPVMPGQWQKALSRAADDPASEPAVSGVPPPEVYVSRACNLARELTRLDPSSPAAVVHVRKHPVENRFEIHEIADGAGKSGAVCTVCNAGQSWQLAVRVGKHDATQVFLLFPLGALGKGNYASGYSALIEESLPSLFRVGGMTEPATLRLIEKSPRTYAVARKMSLSISDASQGPN